jgi:hypothetical protein
MALFTVKKGAEIEKALQQAVKGQTTVLPQRPEYAKLLEGIAREFGGSFSLMGRDARNLAGKLRASAPLQTTDALALKRLLDRSRTSGSFKMNQKLSAKQDEYKQAADQLRGVLHQDQAIAGLLTEERIMIEALDNLVDFGVKSGNRKFTDMVDRLILTGGALMPAMAPGAVATVGAVKGAQSAFMLTNLGQGLHMLRGVVEPAAKAATGTMRAGTATLTGGQ